MADIRVQHSALELLEYPSQSGSQNGT